jgi:gliding motility-associated lipoprotein GldH
MVFQTKFFRITALILIPGLMLLTACGESAKYSNSIEFEDGVWNYDQHFENTFEISDTSGRFNLVLDINHSRDYPFQNVYMNIHTHFPDDTEITDMLSIDFADRSGVWHGNCRSDYCDLRVYLQQNIGFREAGEYRVVFEQYTRREDLRGIQSMEFKILPR